MSNDTLEELVQRLAQAEQDIASLRRRDRRTRMIATGLALIAVFAMAAAWSTATTQGPGLGADDRQGAIRYR